MIPIPRAKLFCSCGEHTIDTVTRMATTREGVELRGRLPECVAVVIQGLVAAAQVPIETRRP